MSNGAEANKDKPKPTTLYKFRSWSDEKHQRVLREGELWVPLAKDLNDPYDCCIPFRYDLMKRHELRQYLAKLVRGHITPKKPWSECDSLAEQMIERVGVYDPARKFDALQSLSVFHRASYAVLSLTGVVANPLMWSHYANCHRGFCVGINVPELEKVLNTFYDTKGVAFQHQWVQYFTNYPIITPSNNEDSDFEAYKKLFTAKSEHWDYEEEYRFVFGLMEAFALHLASPCFTDVILGSEMPQQHRDEIAAITKEKYPHAKLLQAKRKTLSFELEFVTL
jgi:hypothetical protein